MKIKNIYLCLLIFSFIIPVPLTGHATWIDVSLEYNLFGHLANKGPLCAPTATINSFMYLRNKYPSMYKNTQLLTDYNKNGIIDLSDLEKDRDLMAGGWTSPSGPSRSGTGTTGASYKSWWEAKAYWFEDWAPNTTILKGMVDLDVSNWYKGSYLTKGVPTWDFLWKELLHEEDIEICISGMHALTLTSLKFEDLDGDKTWDAGKETAKIDYLDPNNTSSLIESILTIENGKLKFNWDNGKNPAEDVYITAAYSESPVPEPATLILLGLGLLSLSGIARKKK